ncbi:MAG: DUF2892 domain-containing protein [Cytophagales bacterium]|nr:MAG: DUF2892 domain-containing protein [Cytophagales bacterium]
MSFTRNVGFVDQIVRALIVIDVVAAYLMGFLSGFSAFALVSFALALIASCITAFCPAYAFMNFTTRQEYEDRRR